MASEVLDMREFYTAYERFSTSLKYQKDKKNLINFLNHIQEAALLDMSLSKQLRIPRLCMVIDNQYTNNHGISNLKDVLARLNWAIANQDYFGLEVAGDQKLFNNFVNVLKRFAKTMRKEISIKMKKTTVEERRIEERPEL